MQRAARILFPAIVVVVVLLLVGVIAAAFYGDNINYCTISTPKEPIDGYIHREGGFLGGGVEDFRIWYRGKTKRTGMDCKVQRSVTEREYERIMYGKPTKTVAAKKQYDFTIEELVSVLRKNGYFERNHSVR